MKRFLYISLITICSTLNVSAQKPYIEYSEYENLINEIPRDIEEILASLPSTGFNDDNDWPIPPAIFNNYVPGPNLVFKTDTLKASQLTANYKLIQPSTPSWLSTNMARFNSALRASFLLMDMGAGKVDFLAWELPEPPTLLPITDSPTVPTARDIPDVADIGGPSVDEISKKLYWLHKLSGAVQFSQAYISPNWYQGGDNNVTLLIDFLWNVKLNQVYNPKWLLESNLHYKLGLYSTPSDKVHKYSISEDLFQWNFTSGLKAAKNWYYSFNLQLKTQFLHNYEANSWTRKAAFLSPGELNLGLGMTYSKANKKKGLNFKAAFAPASYNLKTCIDKEISPTQFGIKTGHKFVNEFGSNADLVLNWQLTSNIFWTSRLFMFTDYTYFASDLENTFNFNINKFLSTQIYVHGRFDSSAPGSSKGWKKWMLKEILSFGFSYLFSTAPN